MSFTPPEPPEPPQLNVPHPPPLVGEGSPWAPIDGENRDRVLDWWRAWWRRVFFPWLAAFLEWLEKWLDAAAEYIRENARQGDPGYSWYTTDQSLTPGIAAVTLNPEPGREPQVGDHVLSATPESGYGVIVEIFDDGDVTVEYLGTLRGQRGPDGIAEFGSRGIETGPLYPYQTLGDTYRARLDDFPQMVGAYYLATSSRCWVRVYASESYMLADADRTPNTPLVISDDHGCYLDFISIPGELTKTLTPGIMFSDLGDGLWVSIVNLDPSEPREIEATFDYRIFKE